MVSIIPQAGSQRVGKVHKSLKPTELDPQQASIPTTGGYGNPNIEQVQAIWTLSRSESKSWMRR